MLALGRHGTFVAGWVMATVASILLLLVPARKNQQRDEPTLDPVVGAIDNLKRLGTDHAGERH